MRDGLYLVRMQCIYYTYVLTSPIHLSHIIIYSQLCWHVRICLEKNLSSCTSKCQNFLSNLKLSEALSPTPKNRWKAPFFGRIFLDIFCLNGNWILWQWPLLVSGRWTRLSTNRHRLPPLPSHFGQHWYPLDFLPNYPARKCFIISAYDVGTVLIISIFIASLLRCCYAPLNWGLG